MSPRDALDSPGRQSRIWWQHNTRIDTRAIMTAGATVVDVLGPMLRGGSVLLLAALLLSAAVALGQLKIIGGAAAGVAEHAVGGRHGLKLVFVA